MATSDEEKSEFLELIAYLHVTVPPGNSENETVPNSHFFGIIHRLHRAFDMEFNKHV